MPEGHDTIIEVSNIMSFVLYTQILKQSVLKPASPGITLIIEIHWLLCFVIITPAALRSQPASRLQECNLLMRILLHFLYEIYYLWSLNYPYFTLRAI